MITDAQLTIVPSSNPLSMVAGAGVSIRSPILDLLGVGVGVAPPSIIGTASVFGTDFGIGSRWRPEIEMAVGTAFTTGNSATLNIALQLAADQGAGGAYQPSTWNTCFETGAIAVARLTAGAQLMRNPIQPAFPPGLQPRYLSLLFQIPSATNFTAGTIAHSLFTWVRDDWNARYAAKNFTVA